MNSVAPNARGRILVIDDEEIAMNNLIHVFKRLGHEVVGCQSGSEGLNQLAKHPFDVVLTDLRMEQIDGMEVLRRCKSLYPDSEVVMITGHASLDSAVSAMKEGAYHYIAKPFRLDEVRQTVRGALEMVLLRKENRELKHRLESFTGAVKIVTQDGTMQKILAMARQVAPTGASVLIAGESGTGKELLARFLHANSERAEGPFVGVNCGAFQEDLLANELFGHEKGAFTGAGERKHGLIEMANGGTLFLDEIGEMTPAMQVKLLRVIQEREVLRVGATRPVAVDVRIIAATNRQLDNMIANGHFRHDLYYRLNVVNLTLPPLRDRRDDIPLLAFYFLKKHAAGMGKEIADISTETLEILGRYDYPGNIRELENIIERGVALSAGDTLESAQLPSNLRQLEIRVVGQGNSLPTLEQRETDYIRLVLERTGGNRTQAAEILGIDRVSLWRKIKKHGLENG